MTTSLRLLSLFLHRITHFIAFSLSVSLLLLLFPAIGYSQVYVEGVNINELPISFCEITTTGAPLFNSGVYVGASYGQVEKSLKNYHITDENGESILFNSIIDAMNHMEKSGWKFVESREEFSKESSYSYYIFFKEKSHFILQTKGSLKNQFWDCLGFLE
jgi:hypothetical protein